MLRKPTLFILGAGASMPYGFQSGRDVYTGFLEQLLLSESELQRVGRTMSEIRRWICSSQEFSAQLLTELCQEMAAFDLGDSVDEFLQLPVTRRFHRVAKAGMAAVIAKRETNTCTQSQHPEAWYGDALRKILPLEPETPTNLRVITLNFDRSWESYLKDQVTFQYRRGIASQQMAANLVPTLHLHGEFAAAFPAWDDSLTIEQRDARMADIVIRSVDTIRLVSEGAAIDQTVIATAQDWIGWADIVCFLGCAYHPFTLDRLNIPASLVRKEVHGTTHKMDAGPLTTVRHRFESAGVAMKFHDKTIRQFLKDESLIHWRYADR